MLNYYIIHVSLRDYWSLIYIYIYMEEEFRKRNRTHGKIRRSWRKQKSIDVPEKIIERLCLPPRRGHRSTKWFHPRIV